MFDLVYYVGVMCIEYMQDLYVGSEALIFWLNNMADPHNTYAYVFPIVALVDSVFAEQYLLAMAGGEWINVVSKWLLAEDRPYWWVRETDYYGRAERPRLLQTSQTCETGPGSPSGHVMCASSHAILFCMWASHIVTDCNWILPRWVSNLGCFVLLMFVTQVAAARMVVAAHFPHQTILGALAGAFFTPLLILTMSDQYVWRAGGSRRAKHAACAAAAAILGFAVYWATALGKQTSVRLAFKWCAKPQYVHVTTTPVFSLVEACANLLAWALFVTPAVTSYRYYTRTRSLLVAFTCGAVTCYFSNLWQDSIPTDNAIYFYIHQFLYYLVLGGVYLRVIPMCASLPWKVSGLKKRN